MAPVSRAGRRIVVLCEGDTEELAVRRFLWRQWRDEGLAGVGLRPINLNGKLEDAANFAADYLDEQDVLSVFTLIDLAGMNWVRHQPDDALELKVGRVRDWLRARLSHPRQAVFRRWPCVLRAAKWQQRGSGKS